MNFFKNFRLVSRFRKKELKELLEQHEYESRKCYHCGYSLGKTQVSWIEQMFNINQSDSNDKLLCKACGRMYHIMETEQLQIEKNKKLNNYLKEKLSAFFHETTIHGVKAVAYSQNKIRRFLYMAMVILFTFLLGKSILLLTLDYYTYPYIKQYTATVKDSMVFPGITICNLNEVQSNNMTLSRIFAAGIKRNNFSHPVFSVEAEAIYSYLFYTSYENFSCRFNRSYPCNDNWTNANMLINMYPYNCISFNVSQPIESNITGSDHGLILKLSFKQLSDWHTSGVRIFLHDPLRDADELDSSFYAGPGLTTFAVIQPESISLLGYPYHPKEGDCVENKQTFSSYSQVNCKLECRSNYIAHECNCLYPFTKGNRRKCTYRDVFACGKRASLEFNRNKSALRNCNCFQSCSYIKYTTRTSTAYYKQSGLNFYVFSQPWVRVSFPNMRPPLDNTQGWKKKRIIAKTHPTDFEVRIYYESFVLKEVSEVPKYERDAILGQFGGQMGLFLGASLITIFEVVELIFTFILNKCYQLSNHIYKSL